MIRSPRLGVLTAVAAAALIFVAGSSLSTSANAADPTPTPSFNPHDGNWASDGFARPPGVNVEASWIPIPKQLVIDGGKVSGSVQATRTLHPSCDLASQGEVAGTIDTQGKLTATLTLRQSASGSSCEVNDRTLAAGTLDLLFGGQVQADGTLTGSTPSRASLSGGAVPTPTFVFRRVSAANRTPNPQFPYDGLWHTNGRLVASPDSNRAPEWVPDAWILFPTDISIDQGVVSGRALLTRTVPKLQPGASDSNGTSLLTGPCDVTQNARLSGRISQAGELVATYRVTQTVTGPGCPAPNLWSGEQLRAARGGLDGDAIRVLIQPRAESGDQSPGSGFRVCNVIGEDCSSGRLGFMRRGSVAVIPPDAGFLADLFGPDGTSGPIPASLLGAMAGLLAVYLGLSVSTMTSLLAPFSVPDEELTPSVASETDPRADPKVVWNPWANAPLDVWNPATSAPGRDGVSGQPGWVWYGRWMPPGEARELIAQDQRREAQDQADAEQSREKWLQDARDRDAAEVRRRLQSEADEPTLKAANQVARDLYDNELRKHLLKIRLPDGTLDHELMGRLKSMMIKRIALGLGDDNEPATSDLDEGLKGTIDDLRHSLIVRLGAAYLSGGVSEPVFYMPQGGFEATAAAADASTGKLTAGGAFLAGVGGALREALPVNTIMLLKDKGWHDSTWGELGAAAVGDVFAAHSLIPQVAPGLRAALGHVEAHLGGEGGVHEGAALHDLAPGAEGHEGRIGEPRPIADAGREPAAARPRGEAVEPLRAPAGETPGAPHGEPAHADAPPTEPRRSTADEPPRGEPQRAPAGETPGAPHGEPMHADASPTEPPPASHEPPPKGPTREPAQEPGPRAEPKPAPGPSRPTEGAPFAPRDAGLSDAHAAAIHDVARDEGVSITARTRGANAIDRIATGDLPKRSTVHAKTISWEDTKIGAPAGEEGRVWLPPKRPTMPTDEEFRQMTNRNGQPIVVEERVAIAQRVVDRQHEFDAHQEDQIWKSRVTSGEIEIDKNGLVRDGVTKKCFASDVDLMSITDRNGNPVDALKEAQVIKELQARGIEVEHGTHVTWKYDPLNRLHGAADSRINYGILGAHEPPQPNAGALDNALHPTGKPLISFHPDKPGPVVAYNRDFPVDPGAEPDLGGTPLPPLKPGAE